MSLENSKRVCRTCSEPSTGSTWHPGIPFACELRNPRGICFASASRRLSPFVEIEHGDCRTKHVRGALSPDLVRTISPRGTRAIPRTNGTRRTHGHRSDFGHDYRYDLPHPLFVSRSDLCTSDLSRKLPCHLQIGSNNSGLDGSWNRISLGFRLLCRQPTSPPFSLDRRFLFLGILCARHTEQLRCEFHLCDHHFRWRAFLGPPPFTGNERRRHSLAR